MDEFPVELIKTLQKVKRVAVLTGAGISAESGVPTFRDAQTGLWARIDPQELATPQAFRREPKLVWDWYAWRRDLISTARPNPGHFALAEMERQFPAFHLITQNIDGLHQQAGSKTILELHGNIHRTKCFTEGRIIDAWPETGETPPHCPHCGGLLRPDVVWFGEGLPSQKLEEAMEAARKCEIFFSIGTSTVVQPAASLPLLALEQGAVVVEINPEETPLTRWATYLLAGPAGEVLPKLVNRVWKEHHRKA